MGGGVKAEAEGPEGRIVLFFANQTRPIYDCSIYSPLKFYRLDDGISINPLWQDAG